MITYLDANIFLRLLTVPTDDKMRQSQKVAQRLFRSVEVGELQVTTSELVLHQTMYFLLSERYYAQPVDLTTEKMRSILAFRGFALPSDELAVFMRAFDVLDSRPSLGYGDCIILARCERNKWSLATFDRTLGRAPLVKHWPEQDS